MLSKTHPDPKLQSNARQTFKHWRRQLKGLSSAVITPRVLTPTAPPSQGNASSEAVAASWTAAVDEDEKRAELAARKAREGAKQEEREVERAEQSVREAEGVSRDGEKEAGGRRRRPTSLLPSVPPPSVPPPTIPPPSVPPPSVPPPSVSPPSVAVPSSSSSSSSSAAQLVPTATRDKMRSLFTRKLKPSSSSSSSSSSTNSLKDTGAGDALATRLALALEEGVYGSILSSRKERGGGGGGEWGEELVKAYTKMCHLVVKSLFTSTAQADERRSMLLSGTITVEEVVSSLTLA